MNITCGECMFSTFLADEEAWWCTKLKTYVDLDFECAEDYIYNAKTIDSVPVVHAHWIKQEREIFKCSNCGNYLDFRGVNAGRGDANYCQNCGSKMDEEQ